MNHLEAVTPALPSLLHHGIDQPLNLLVPSIFNPPLDAASAATKSPTTIDMPILDASTGKVVDTSLTDGQNLMSSILAPPPQAPHSSRGSKKFMHDSSTGVVETAFDTTIEQNAHGTLIGIHLTNPRAYPLSRPSTCSTNTSSKTCMTTTHASFISLSSSASAQMGQRRAGLQPETAEQTQGAGSLARQTNGAGITIQTPSADVTYAPSAHSASPTWGVLDPSYYAFLRTAPFVD
ncbi:hypothetical protein DACRYDRAFT_103867 [Dacryopinax primogenitus]|uniref:Uncharacterized protein n=1 Tax=Dacryopinax primogenitus (strain DJM 731) TaxID=1858805 RepID=M5GAJ7_DACPD|nr:uncharacterized protein DACRYDRAFT_103867 [Dacryopinax primogenitus]EJU05380.1 hypothetical protein DACRYDRAFT_103867 [Dacryopinax primogenitus]